MQRLENVLRSGFFIVLPAWLIISPSTDPPVRLAVYFSNARPPYPFSDSLFHFDGGLSCDAGMYAYAVLRVPSDPLSLSSSSETLEVTCLFVFLLHLSLCGECFCDSVFMHLLDVTVPLLTCGFTAVAALSDWRSPRRHSHSSDVGRLLTFQ
ncbi:hypothetical protein EmuJ_000722400 [Echinococcus multilocularis]|uniref:Uncharacterized protein n=1 Tax=Echinococcus multilocularis TaxID=6211 RepID=A0A068Y8U6_ECHMU|nr:hypothetical protein EmuJ_000722400 [Echinococcus multilocularis]